MLVGKLSNGSGKRNTEIVIQSAVDGTANDTGEVLPVFATYCTRFAEAVPSGGREFVAALSVQPLLQSIYKLPYDSETALITPRMRGTVGSRVFNIAAVINENENNEKIVIWATEPVAL